MFAVTRPSGLLPLLDRKSTRLNSSHLVISYGLLLGSEEHTSELQSPCNLVCRLLLGKKKHTAELLSPCNVVCRLFLHNDRQPLVADGRWTPSAGALASWCSYPRLCSFVVFF